MNTSKSLCGHESLRPMNVSSLEFGPCFFRLALDFPIHVSLLLFLAYKIGDVSVFSHFPFLNSSFYPSKIVSLCSFTRILSSYVLTLVSVYNLTIVSTDVSGLSKILSEVTRFLSYASCTLYYILLHKKTKGREIHDRPWMCLLFLYCLDICLTLIAFRLQVSQVSFTPTLSLIISLFSSLSLVFFSFCPSFCISSSNLTSTPIETTPLLLSSRSRNEEFEGGFSFDTQGISMVSKLTFSWVSPLLKPSHYDITLSSSSDIFELPRALRAGVAVKALEGSLFKYSSSSNLSKYWLLQLLFHNYGAQFLKIGLLKFLADIFSLLSPILLHSLLSVLEISESESPNSSPNIRIYGLGLSVSLFLCTVAVSFFNSHFNYLMGTLEVQMSGGLLIASYQKILKTPNCSYHRFFSQGEKLNLLTIDKDKLLNFFPSLHALWSLPLSFCLSLFLLYSQLGIASLSGLLLSLSLLPLNKWIANKIGKTSSVMMEAKDERIDFILQTLQRLPTIKMFAWENFFAFKIRRFRSKELEALKWRKILDALCVFLWASTPFLISVLSFSTYVLLGHELSASKVFTSMALFSMLSGPLNAFPWVINGIIEAFVSLHRLSSFLSTSDEFEITEENGIESENEEKTKIIFKNASFSVSPSFKLQNLSFSIQPGDFIGVFGPIGSGKTSLLYSFLGEIRQIGGLVQMSRKGGLAYVSTDPWLQNKSIRENILFGKEYSESLYTSVLKAAVLTDDLEKLKHGDKTRIGERGSCLSGGQRVRVSLARALYQNVDIYLLDDIFSALDSKVSSLIYQRVLQGALSTKTVILSSHQSLYLSESKMIFKMKEGKIDSIEKPILSLSQIPYELKEFNEKYEENESYDCFYREENKYVDEEVEEEEEGESKENGALDICLVSRYALAVGKGLSLLILLSLVFFQLLSNSTDVWLSFWLSKPGNNSKTLGFLVIYQPQNDKYVEENKKYIFLLIIGSLTLSASLMALLRALSFAMGGLRAARTLHDDLLSVTLMSTLSYAQRTPLGLLLNRFSNDIYTIDDSLPFILNIFLAQANSVLGALLVCSLSLPWYLSFLAPLLLLYFSLQSKYRAASRELKRTASLSLSPLTQHLTESLESPEIIRSYLGALPLFVKEAESLSDKVNSINFSSKVIGIWLELRLQFLGCLLVLSLSILSILSSELRASKAASIGLAISYALGITSKLSGLVLSFTETEKEFIAVERVANIIQTVPLEKQENEKEEKLRSRPENWPSEGIIEFAQVYMKYDEESPIVLRNLSFKTRAHEKIGIVGRTGAGKSSLFSALFRSSPYMSGHITIDGLDLSSLSPQNVRETLTLLPQDPFLFSGTFRENLDPLEIFSDEALRRTLATVHLSEKIPDLNSSMKEFKDRMSNGEKQLFALARALLSSAHIICIDEASANVDYETDSLIQRIIASAFQNRTVLTIAHRVDNICNYDRVLVMSDGEIVENDSPKLLLEDPQSHFTQLLRYSALK